MKYTICNELFGSMPLAETCALLREQGYQGIEIAPFTLFEDPRTLAKERIREIDRIIRDNGLEFTGFHWFFQTPSGLHITRPDAEIRKRSWDHLKRLLEIAGGLGGGVLVLGSPKQRGAVGIPAEQAVNYLQEGLASVADFAVEQGCVVLLESLSGEATNVVNTMAEADKGYECWVSLEIFHEPEDPARVLAETKRFLDSMPSCTI